MIPIKWPSVTTGLALYGAVLATFNAAWTWSSRRRRIHVTVAWAIPAYNTHLGPRMLSIQAVNGGHQPVNLKSAGFLLPDEHQVVFPYASGTVKLPHQLDAGDNCIVWVNPGDIAFELKQNGYSGHVKLRGFYLDGTDKRQQSKSVDFDVEKHLPYVTTH